MFLKWCLIFIPAVASAQEASLGDFLKSAWDKSPVIKAESLQNQASDQFVDATRGRYLPQVTLGAIDTTGFAASTSALGVTGIAGSPFRQGWGVDATVTETVYDFGRISSALEAAKADKSAAQARLAAEKYRYLLGAGRVYLACARSRSIRDVDNELMTWAKMNLKETARFTKSGQRSVIDNALVKTEVEKLQLELDQLAKFQTSLIEQMKLYMGTPGCQGVAETVNTAIPADLQIEDPTQLLAKARIDLSNARAEGAKANQRPTINVLGSVGGMEEARLVIKEDYSAGVGIVFPIWNGGEDYHRQQAYKSETDFEKQNLRAAQLEFDIRTKNITDQFQRNKETLAVLRKNLEQVQKTIKLASERYRLLEGPLIDVRESFSQLRAMEVQRVELEASLASDALELGLLKTK